MPVNEPITKHMRPNSHSNTNSSANAANRVGDTPPTLITKKWLCIHFNVSRSRPDPLYRYILTPEVLEQLDLCTETVRSKGFKTFNAQQSKILIQLLLPWNSSCLPICCSLRLLATGCITEIHPITNVWYQPFRLWIQWWNKTLYLAWPLFWIRCTFHPSHGENQAPADLSEKTLQFCTWQRPYGQPTPSPLGKKCPDVCPKWSV